MANQFSKGHVFVPGEVVDPQDLNDLVDQAIAQLTGGLITEQPSVSAATGDSILVSDVSDSGKLKKALISTLPGAGTVTSVAFTATPSPIFSLTGSPVTTSGTIALGLDPQLPNKFLAGPTSGTTIGTPGFRALVPKDTATLQTIALTTIDCSLGNAFSKVLSATTNTFLLQNGIAGQIVKIWLRQYSGHGTVAWNTAPATLYWRGGTVPVMNTTAGNVDIYTFFFTGPEVFAYSDQNFS